MQTRKYTQISSKHTKSHTLQHRLAAVTRTVDIRSKHERPYTCVCIQDQITTKCTAKLRLKVRTEHTTMCPHRKQDHNLILCACRQACKGAHNCTCTRTLSTTVLHIEKIRPYLSFRCKQPNTHACTHSYKANMHAYRIVTPTLGNSKSLNGLSVAVKAVAL